MYEHRLVLSPIQSISIFHQTYPFPYALTYTATWIV
jgi:hypothetical protein